MRSWTTGERNELRMMVAHGLTFEVIAERLGRTRKAIAIAVLRAGIRSTRQANWSTAEIRRARMLYDGGMSCTRIGAVLRRTEASVRAQLNRRGGLDSVRKRTSRRRDYTTAYSLWARGLTMTEVLLVLGESVTETRKRTMNTWVRRYAKRANLPVPAPHGRNRTNWERVEAERRRMYGEAVPPLDRMCATS